MTTSRLLAPVVIAAALVLAGCGDSAATVSGTVSYQGKPLTGGAVTLLASDGQIHSGTIAPDGKFRIDGVRSGALKVGVTGPQKLNAERAAAAGGGRAAGGGPAAGRGSGGPPQGDAPAPAPTPSGPTVPTNYADPQTSGLTGNADGSPLVIDLK